MIFANITRGKIWGSTSTIFSENNVEIARIDVKKDTYCSKHRHTHKYNMFFVERGLLEIIIYRNDAGKALEDKTILKAGSMTYVEPMVYHLFRALEDTVAYEIYWVELDKNDIDRENVGGVIDSPTSV